MVGGKSSLVVTSKPRLFKRDLFDTSKMATVVGRLMAIIAKNINFSIFTRFKRLFSEVLQGK